MPSSSSLGPILYLRVSGSCRRKRCFSSVVTRPQTVALFRFNANAISLMPSAERDELNNEMMDVARSTDWMTMA